MIKNTTIKTSISKQAIKDNMKHPKMLHKTALKLQEYPKTKWNFSVKIQA